MSEACRVQQSVTGERDVIASPRELLQAGMERGHRNLVRCRYG